jgi:hypothetical protein
MKRLSALCLLLITASQGCTRPDVKVWTRQVGTAAFDEGCAVAADPSGNCIIAGATQGALESGGKNAGRYDMFVGKYDAAGNLLWLKQRGTREREFAYGLATDAAGNLYATGYTGAALDGQSHAGRWDIFLMKFGPDGDWRWTRQFGAGQDDEGYAVATDPSGHVYITGYVRGAIHDQPRAGSADAFISKYDAEGNRLWTRLLGSNEIDQAWAICGDASGGVFVTGYCLGPIDGNPYLGNGDLFLARYNAEGHRLWLRQWGTENAEHGYSLAAAPDGGVYLSGYTTGALYGPRMGGRDVFLARFDAAGNQRWGRQFGTAEHDQGWGVAMTSEGHILLAGQVAGPIFGNPHHGGLDIFLSRYDPSGTRRWTTQLGTADNELARGIATTPDGHTFLAGTTAGPLDAIANKGATDAFAIKLTPRSP